METACEAHDAQATSASVRARVDDVLARFLDEKVGAFEDEAVRAVVGTVRNFVVMGGKRIRPVLCYWGWRGAEGDDCGEIVRAASVLEIFHAFRLIHDDIIDGSDLRGGRPSLHRALADRHTSRRWRGDPRQFGVSIAILLGDLCMAWADELLHTGGMPSERLAAARTYYQHMRSEVCYGQQLDILEQARGPFTTERSMTVVRFKSAKYTVERPLHLGGVLAGASPALLAAYSAFGVALGEAFQLRDDILGAFGDPAVTGKPNLDDLRTAKPTVLVAHALRHADPVQRRLLDRTLGDPALDENEAGRVRHVLVETGAVATAERMIDERVERARAALESAPIAGPARQALADLIGAAVRRTC